MDETGKEWKSRGGVLVPYFTKIISLIVLFVWCDAGFYILERTP